MLTCSVEAPLPLAIRIAAFGVMGSYLLITAFTGTCYVSRWLGRSNGAREAEQ